jgi:neutral ceramidase
MTIARILSGCCLLLSLVGCGYPLPAAYSEPPQKASAPEAIRVGTARVDITPPPGVSTFGHASDSRVTDGVWTRLYCRVFAFETASHERLAIVPCDLAAMSTLLQRAVAAKLEGTLPATRLMMSATHTHAGPAHYFDALAFSDALSTQMPGFDRRIVELLANRIATGVKDAFHVAAPASLSWAHYENDPPNAKQGMWGISWNRSLPAYQYNPRDEDNTKKAPIWTPPSGLDDVQASIDPTIHVLRIASIDPTTSKDGPPIGVLAFFAMHPTVLGHENQLIGADTQGVVSRELERRLRIENPDGPEPLAGIVHTNEGNMSPKWFAGTKSEAVQIGKAIAGRIEALMETAKAVPGARSVRLDVRYREVDLPDAQVREGSDAAKLCDQAEPGESFAHGACDHPATFSPTLLFPGPPLGRQCQYPKRGLGGALAITLAGAGEAFPRRVPLALVRIADTLISFVPAEMTITAGHAVNQEVLKQSHGSASHAVIAGLSNGYILYVASPDEFAYNGQDGACLVHQSDDVHNRQSYEASSTLYGPNTGPFLAHQFGLLARSLADPKASSVRSLDPPIGKATSFSVSPGFGRPRLAEEAGEKEPKLSSTAPAWICTLPRPKKEPLPTLCFRWSGPAPGSVPLNPGPWIELRRAAETETSGVDDRGYAFVTRVRNWDPSEWSVLIRPDAEDWRRIGVNESTVVYVNGKNATQSVPFTSQALPTECNVEQVAWCGSFDEPAAKFHPYPRPNAQSTHGKSP